MSTDNLHFHKHRVSRELKETRNNHKSRVIWFTGLSGSGKSTVANATENCYMIGVYKPIYSMEIMLEWD